MLSIGLMSGTSMDGIDAALIDTDGQTFIKDLGMETLHYDADFKILLKAAEYCTKKFSGDISAVKSYYQQGIEEYLRAEYKLVTSVPEKLKSLSLYFHGNENLPITFDQVVRRSTELHDNIVKRLLAKTHYKASQIDIIGYHGQTLFHRPAAKLTIQIGEGELLAALTGITVINDFRSRDIANGGQGAPFAPLYHQALAVRDNKFPVVIVNCGGIANVTVVTGCSGNEVMGFDTGPGNGLIDRYIKQLTQGQQTMDLNGEYGKKGKVDDSILNLLYQKSICDDGKNYFLMAPPKSLDIGDLVLIPELDALMPEDVCATLEAFTADTIVNSMQHFSGDIPRTWVLAGGGWNNPIIYGEFKTRLEKKLGADLHLMTADEAGWNRQAMEAQIFAYLGVRSLLNLPISLPTTTQVSEPMSGGRAHIPQAPVTPAVAKALENNPQLLFGYNS